jgi:hypothetical protein
VSKVAQSADLGMFERKGRKNVILRCAMGGCIKVVLNYFFDFLEKKKVLEAVNFWPHISYFCCQKEGTLFGPKF